MFCLPCLAVFALVLALDVIWDSDPDLNNRVRKSELLENLGKKGGRKGGKEVSDELEKEYVIWKRRSELDEGRLGCFRRISWCLAVIVASHTSKSTMRDEETGACFSYV